MYIPLGNVHRGRLGSPVINPFDGQIGLWKYGFNQAETDDVEDEEENGKKKARLVTPGNPPSIYSGYGAFVSPGLTITGGVVGAIMAAAALAVKWSLTGDPKPFTDELKENWYCLVGGAAMIVVWEQLSGMFRS